MNQEIEAYHNNLPDFEKEICDTLYHIINENLLQAEHKIWHAHPVWFLDGNPIVGYSKQKAGIRLMFWSGADFEEPQLNVLGKKFKDASLFYTIATDINEPDLKRWLQKATTIQYDYKNIVKRKGVLVKL
ncbi:DUF1801 domain-containing protein [Flavobacterium haoranii]|uniref:YdhG-like domain-containing protein n=1 Tax=Flavobacterium haoranii TaxID=683124 RepID=A0A1M6LGJ1_9FLAO|nr:DUF1801 domain-containing protein [Flavobacterium haoranii]SHJ70306.1 protein of unknown function (DU1801) [Flavobacterium haoranii]